MPGGDVARSSSASTWAPSTSSSRSSRRSPSPAACSASAAPATTSATRARAASSRSSAPTCSSARSSRASCARAASSRRSSRATRSTSSPSRSSPSRPRRTTPRRRSRSTPCTRSSPGRTPTPSSRARCWRTSSTCSTAATRRRSSASCARASSGTASPARSARARARGSSRSTNAGTIPDRGLFAVVLPDGRRVGELDEEMVYEARPGQTFLLGASSWRIEEIGRDRVVVSPAPGVPGAVPFWRGDSVGRPKPLGEAIGAFSRWAVDQTAEVLGRDYDLDPLAARNLLDYLREQQEATRVVPSDRAIVVERFRDEIGDWRLCILTPFGGRVHSAWALALSARIRDEYGLESDAIWSDDGIIVHLPDADEPPGADLVLVLEPDELEDLVVGGAGRERALRRALPRERRPLAAHPARLPGQAHAAVAAAAEVAVAAGGGQALRRLPGDPRDLPRVPARRPGPARPDRAAHRAAPARDLARRGRDADGVAVRLLAALRLRRDVHVRGRHAQRRAARRGALARPRPPARAARPGGAARAHRRRRARAGRGRPPAPLRAHAARRPGTSSATCCGASAT